MNAKDAKVHEGKTKSGNRFTIRLLVTAGFTQFNAAYQITILV